MALTLVGMATTTTGTTGTTQASAAPSRTPALGVVVVSLAACAVAVVIGGAAVPAVAGIEDVGAVVRWGLPPAARRP